MSYPRHDSGSAMQQDPRELRDILQAKLKKVEGQLRGESLQGTPSDFYGPPIGTPKRPPLAEESVRPNFIGEIDSTLHDLMSSTNVLIDEIFRLRETLAFERKDRQQEQEQTLKILHQIQSVTREPFEVQEKSANAPQSRY